jgi:glycerol-3-phosphate dehydrogenase (NAD(P)+)
MNCIVVGAGAWGSAFAKLLRDRGHEVAVARRDTIDDQPYDDADLVVLAVPSSAFGDVVARVRGEAPVLSLTKGLDPASGQRLSRLVERRPVAVLSGPNMADEVLAGLPGAAVIASQDAALAEQLQEAVNSPLFRVYVNADLIGVELCAAAKNVIALAAGGVDGLGLGDIA